MNILAELHDTMRKILTAMYASVANSEDVEAEAEKLLKVMRQSIPGTTIHGLVGHYEALNASGIADKDANAYAKLRTLIVELADAEISKALAAIKNHSHLHPTASDAMGAVSKAVALCDLFNEPIDEAALRTVIAAVDPSYREPMFTAMRGNPITRPSFSSEEFLALIDCLQAD